MPSPGVHSNQGGPWARKLRRGGLSRVLLYAPSDRGVRAGEQCQVRRVQRSEEARFQELMRAQHYLGALPKIGETLSYVATWQQEWIALPCFQAAAPAGLAGATASSTPT
jgi:hypothetical protein